MVRRTVPILCLAFLLLASCILAPPVKVVAQTVMTPSDSAAVLLEAARAFESEGRWQVAEALYHFIGERFGDTPAGMEARVALQDPNPEAAGRESRTELAVWGTTYGLWLGVAIPGALGADDPAPYGVGLLLGGPGGFLGGRALARSGGLSMGQARAITFGSLWGTWQGWALLEIMDWGREEHCHMDMCWREDPDGAAVLRSMVVGGLAGVATGAILARKPIPSGVATTATLGGLWGAWFGLAGAVVGGADGDGALTGALIGGNAGLLYSALKAPDWGFSRPRARLISISGVIGLLGGFGLDLIVQPDDEQLAMLLPMLTSAVGLAIGLEATEDRDRLPADTGGTVAGAGASHGFASALLSMGGGGLSLGLPMPAPTLLPVDGPRGFSYRPGLAFNLFSSRF
jgi:hypothetical protein